MRWRSVAIYVHNGRVALFLEGHFIQWNCVKPYLSCVCDVVKLLLWSQAGWERQVEVLCVIVHALKEAGQIQENEN